MLHAIKVIPDLVLSDIQLDALIERLDTDGDGEYVVFGYFFTPATFGLVVFLLSVYRMVWSLAKQSGRGPIPLSHCCLGPAQN